jgi:hypothetical protein
MSRRKLSFTEKRRARLAMKFGRLDRLETRNTITEPISVSGLSLSAFSAAANLGIMHADGGNSALLGLAQMAQQARQGLTRAQLAAAAPYTPSTLAIGLPLKQATSGSAGGGSAVQDATNQKISANQSQTVDWLALMTSSDSASSESVGISIPWRPAARVGGGAAQPPRGGSGSGAQAATIALVSGRGGHTQAQPQSAAPATIPGFLASNPPQTAHAIGNNPAPIITRNSAASRIAPGGAGSSDGLNAAPMGTSSPPVTVAENPSSLPSSSVGNSSPFSQMSFQYFPLYVLDENNGIVLFN